MCNKTNQLVVYERVKIFFHKESKVAIDFTLIKVAEKIYKVNISIKEDFVKTYFFSTRRKFLRLLCLLTRTLKKRSFNYSRQVSALDAILKRPNFFGCMLYCRYLSAKAATAPQTDAFAQKKRSANITRGNCASRRCICNSNFFSKADIFLFCCCSIYFNFTENRR